MKLYIGTSGFSYTYWKNRFYPEKLPTSQWLAYYATQFNTLELNNTFYRFPRVKTLEKQREIVPKDFVFSVKAHKIITHTLRMRNAKEKVREFMDLVQDGLQEKLGCVLFQLPPTLAYSEENLNHILESVPHAHQHIIECRHQSWWQEEVWQILQKNKLTFCRVNYPGLPVGPFIKEPLVYVRMHGVPELFKSSYNDEELKQLHASIPTSKSCYIYFNNTMFEAGYENARTMQKLFGEK